MNTPPIPDSLSDAELTGYATEAEVTTARLIIHQQLHNLHFPDVWSEFDEDADGENRQRYDEGYWIGSEMRKMDHPGVFTCIMDPLPYTRYKYESEGIHDGCANQPSNFQKTVERYNAIDYLRQVCQSPEGKQQVINVMGMLHSSMQ